MRHSLLEWRICLWLFHQVKGTMHYDNKTKK